MRFAIAPVTSISISKRTYNAAEFHNYNWIILKKHQQDKAKLKPADDLSIIPFTLSIYEYLRMAYKKLDSFNSESTIPSPLTSFFWFSFSQRNT